MSDWNYPGVFGAVARVQPDAPALIHGDRRVTWSEFDVRTTRLAGALARMGVLPGEAVALYMPNRPEYLESFVAVLKAGAVPVNTNYRYVDDELEYLWNDAQVRGVVFDHAFHDRVDRVRSRVPAVRAWVEVDGGTPEPWTMGYEEEAEQGAPVETSGEDPLILLYTGGTTGFPKGVMWRQADLLSLLGTTGPRSLTDGAGRAEIEERLRELGPGPAVMVACPLMHGTGLMHALAAMTSGGSIVTVPSPKLDVEMMLDIVVKERVKGIVIVGDPFARPIVEQLDREPDRWDLSSLRVMFSSGAMWSREIKQRLLSHIPRLRLVDGLGSSEASALGDSVSVASDVGETATFRLSDNAAVLLDDGTFATPGDGRTGQLALSGWIPLGYHNDPEKTARVFRTVSGRRWSVPGDFAQLEADGRIRLLGRGSGCINTAGEKVFPEEVEEVLKRYPGVGDAAVVGVPDARFGEAVSAVIEPVGETPDLQLLEAYAREHLAGYKVPKMIHVVPSLGRAPNGKLDLTAVRVIATEVWQGLSV